MGEMIKCPGRWLWVYLNEWLGGVSSIVEGSGARTCVTHDLRKCIWNVPVVSLVLQTFDNTGSLGSPLHQVVYPPGYMVPLWVTASHFLFSGNREAELKPTTFSSFLLLSDFLSFLFS